jgi:membrane-associated phospholipid phosphatase
MNNPLNSTRLPNTSAGKPKERTALRKGLTIWHCVKSLLPHEVMFGLFLLVTWIRLGAHAGWLGSDALIYLGLILLNLAAIWCYRSSPAPWRWRLGLLYYPLAMNFTFYHLQFDLPKIHPGKFDAALWHIDSLMIGGSLSVRAEALVHPALTDFMSFCYFLFLPYLLFSQIYYFSSDAALLKKFVIGLFTIYGFGFLGYSFVPAAGPCIAFAHQFSVPLTGGWLTDWNTLVVNRGSNGVDAFPSLHCAVSTFLLGFDYRHRLWRFKLYVVPCIGLWFSTIYLRYHYFIDVVCGFLLAALALWLADRFPLTQDCTTDGEIA